MASMRCPQCQFVNFAYETQCKRCQASLAVPATSAPQSYAPPTQYYTPSPSTLAQYAPPPAAARSYTPPPATPPPYQQPAAPPYGTPYQAPYQPAAQPYSRPPNPEPAYAYQGGPGPYRQAAQPPNQTHTGVWRRQDQIVMRRDADLPDHCVKCNGPVFESDKIRQRFYWHSPLLYGLLISPLIYAIVAAIVSKRTSLYVGLCEEHQNGRRGALIAAWVSGLVGFMGLFVAVSAESFGMFMVCLLLMVLGPLLGHYVAQPLRTTEIDDNYIWLKGAAPEFVNSLPAWETRQQTSPYR